MRSIGLLSLLLCGLVSAHSASASGFRVKSLISTDPGAAAVAAGDFNRDGKVDLVVAAYTVDEISVLLGNGDGSFQSAVKYPVGNSPFGVTVADVNLDGNADLLVSNASDDTISVLLGNGDGSFQPASSFATGNDPIALAVGDLNNDGVPDVVTASIGVTVLLGNGDGSFQPPVDVYSPGAYSVAVGDFNHDGKLDVAVGTDLGAAGSVQVLVGNGDGTFISGDSYSLNTATPYSIAVGDLNHDGRLDVAVTTLGLGIYVLLGHGDGTFKTPVVYITGYASYAVVISDFNRDGKADLAIADFVFPAYASILPGKGDGTFAAVRNYPTGGYLADAIVAADFNQDGSPELGVANRSTSNVTIFLNTGGTLIDSASSRNPSKVGQTVTFTARVKQSVPGTGVPTGTITFKDGTVTLGTASLVSGKAMFTTSGLSQGTHNIVAAYSGDANFNPNSAKPLAQVVNP